MNREAPRVQLCRTDDVAAGAVLKVETAGLKLAVYNVDWAFYVTDDACTHGPGSLSEGFLDGEIIECNFHQGCFNVRTGEVLQPPCVVPISTYTTTIEAGAIFIDVPLPAAPSDSDSRPS